MQHMQPKQIDMKKFIAKYGEMYKARQRSQCLEMLFENGFAVPNQMFLTVSNSKCRMRNKAIKKIWQQRKNIFHLWDESDEMPVKDIAIYDLSKRQKTLQMCKERIFRTINYAIQPDEIYMYNPDNLNSGYQWYSGQKLIVYQIQRNMNKLKREQIWKDINVMKIGPYELTDPLHFVKKIILLDTDDVEKYHYVVYDLGDDTTSLKDRFLAAWYNHQISPPPKVFKCVKKNKSVSNCRIGQLKVIEKKRRCAQKPHKTGQMKKQRKFLSYAISADFL